MRSGLIRAITTEENASIEASWIRRIRRGMAVQVMVIIFFIAYAFYTAWSVVLVIIPASLALTLLCSYRDLKCILKDIHNGTVEEITGSVQKDGRFNIVVATAFLGPAIHSVAGLILQFIKSMHLKNGSLSFTLFSGNPLLLVAPGLKMTICVDPDTYRNLGDGALIKASVLPGSRLAFKVQRTRLDTI